MVAKKKTLKISPPAGARTHKLVKRKVGGRKPAAKRTGGFLPLAALAPLAIAAGVPLATALGVEATKGVKYGVKKLRSLLGIGLIRAGNTRAMGGRRKKC